MKVLGCFRHIHIVNSFLSHSFTMKVLEGFRHVRYVDMSISTLSPWKVLEGFRHIHIVNRFYAILEHNDIMFLHNDIFLFKIAYLSCTNLMT
jgi:hypothetical protein